MGPDGESSGRMAEARYRCRLRRYAVAITQAEYSPYRSPIENQWTDAWTSLAQTSGWKRRASSASAQSRISRSSGSPWWSGCIAISPNARMMCSRAPSPSPWWRCSSRPDCWRTWRSGRAKLPRRRLAAASNSRPSPPRSVMRHSARSAGGRPRMSSLSARTAAHRFVRRVATAAACLPVSGALAPIVPRPGVRKSRLHGARPRPFPPSLPYPLPVRRWRRCQREPRRRARLPSNCIGNTQPSTARSSGTIAP